MADKDFIIAGGTLREYVGTSTVVVIPDGVTKIDWLAFSKSPQIKELVFPESVERIDRLVLGFLHNIERVEIRNPKLEIIDELFQFLNNLVEVVLPSELKVIPRDAFNGCTKLEKVIIPSTVRVIEEGAFSKCRNLKSVSLPEGLERIGPKAFFECVHLTGMVFPRSLKKIGNKAFSHCFCLKERPNLPSDFILGESAFEGCGFLADENGMIISDDVFYGLTREYEELIIPSGIHRISDYACFDDVCIKKLVIPESVKHISKNAFENCTSLSSLEIAGEKVSIGDEAFKNCSMLAEDGLIIIKDALCGHTSVSGTLVLPERAHYINSGALDGCETLDELILPEGFGYIGHAGLVYTSISRLDIRGWDAPYGFNFLPRITQLKEVLTNVELDEDIFGYMPKLSKFFELDIYTNDLYKMPKAYRDSILIGFFNNRSGFAEADIRSYIQYASENGVRLIDKVFEFSNVFKAFIEYKIITSDNFETFFNYANLIGDVEKTAMLLNYKKNYL